MTRSTLPDELAISQEVARRLRQHRIDLGLSQNDLARMVGISQQQLLKYELGRDRLSVGKLVLLAHALKVAPGSLFEEYKPRPRSRRVSWQQTQVSKRAV